MSIYDKYRKPKNRDEDWHVLMTRPDHQPAVVHNSDVKRREKQGFKVGYKAPKEKKSAK